MSGTVERFVFKRDDATATKREAAPRVAHRSTARAGGVGGGRERQRHVRDDAPGR
jgi:hypothetical protein